MPTRRTLTDKQRDALLAVAFPHSRFAYTWWSMARLGWQGPRKTLGSLITRDLVTYEHGRDPLWQATDKGHRLAEEVRRDR